MGLYNKNWSVVVDVDDVLNNLMAETIKKADADVFLEDFTEYDISECVTEEVHEALDAVWSNKSFWDNLAPAKGAVEAMRKLVQNGIEVYIMTACTPDIVEGRAKWFAKHFPFIKQDNIIYGHPKWLVSCDFMIEDKLETLLRTPSWTHRLLLDKPWNKYNEEKDAVYAIMRGKTITELIDKVVEIVDDERNW